MSERRASSERGSRERAPGRVLDAALNMLDRQVIDSAGRMVCKVDDLELELDGAGRPFVTAILAGPGALGPRLGGRLGEWVVALGRRLAMRPDGGPPRIDAGLVADIGSAVTLAVSRREVRVAALEDWVREHVIDRLPGASNANE